MKQRRQTIVSKMVVQFSGEYYIILKEYDTVIEKKVFQISHLFSVGSDG